jgi:hypothetical protein
VDYYDLDSLHRLTHERHEQRLREAGTERLARELRGSVPKRARSRSRRRYLARHLLGEKGVAGCT